MHYIICSVLDKKTFIFDIIERQRERERERILYTFNYLNILLGKR